jgi:amino acid transporter
VVIGSTIGSGIFRTPALVAQKIDDVPLFLLAWVIGGAVAICGALTYAELAAKFPRSGGIYVFLREAFGPLPRFSSAGLNSSSSGPEPMEQSVLPRRAMLSELSDAIPEQ